MNTIFSYMYADACNYKIYKDVVIGGELEFSDIEPYLHEGEFFIPSEIGLDDLQPTPLTTHDHIWHSICNLSASNINSNCTIDSAQLIKRFLIASENRWNTLDVFQRNGLM